MEVCTLSPRRYLRTTTRYTLSRLSPPELLSLLTFSTFSPIPFCYSSLLFSDFILFYFYLDFEIYIIDFIIDNNNIKIITDLGFV